VRPPARQSPAGAALRPDWHVRILTGFLAFCTRRTRVPQRVLASPSANCLRESVLDTVNPQEREFFEHLLPQAVIYDFNCA